MICQGFVPTPLFIRCSAQSFSQTKVNFRFFSRGQKIESENWLNAQIKCAEILKGNSGENVKM